MDIHIHTYIYMYTSTSIYIEREIKQVNKKKRQTTQLKNGQRYKQEILKRRKIVNKDLKWISGSISEMDKAR